MSAAYHATIRAILAARVPARAKVLAIYLLDRQGDNGHAWPSWRTICGETRTSSETIGLAMTELIEANILTKTTPDRPSAGNTNHYVVNRDCSTWAKRFVRAKRSVRVERKRFVRVEHNDSVERLTSNPPTPQGGNRAPVKSHRKKINGSVLTAEQETAFDRFWKVYPRREKKESARKAWASLNPNGELDSIMSAAGAMAQKAAAGQFCKAATGERLGFCPHPASWLNDRRWEDKPDDGGMGGKLPDGCVETKPMDEDKADEIFKMMAAQNG